MSKSAFFSPRATRYSTRVFQCKIISRLNNSNERPQIQDKTFSYNPRAAGGAKPAQATAGGLLIALAGWLLFTSGQSISAPRELPPQTGAARPNVILITIDTLRADHLGVYGDKEIQTPFI
ncbi:MAG TPA: hypothetical protein VFF11_13485, partial [Candidatus Binatia bacterium]|nr:hypothetical protein [Candidatus Binatia bacterium]